MPPVCSTVIPFQKFSQLIVFSRLSSCSAKGLGRFAIATAVSLLAVSCSESKVSQCNKLIEVANKAVSDVKTVTSSASPQDVSAMTKIATIADQATASMQALKLTDKELQTYQGRFTTMYSNTSKATRTLVEAVGAKNSQAAEQAYSALQTATDQEDPLVKEVNTYCTSSS